MESSPQAATDGFWHESLEWSKEYFKYCCEVKAFSLAKAAARMQSWIVILEPSSVYSPPWAGAGWTLRSLPSQTVLGFTEAAPPHFWVESACLEKQTLKTLHSLMASARSPGTLLVISKASLHWSSSSMSRLFGHLHIKPASARSSGALCCTQPHIPMTFSQSELPNSSLPAQNSSGALVNAIQKRRISSFPEWFCVLAEGTLLTLFRFFSWSFLTPNLNYCKESFCSRSRPLTWTFWCSWHPCELSSPALWSPGQHSAALPLMRCSQWASNVPHQQMFAISTQGSLAALRNVHFPSLLPWTGMKQFPDLSQELPDRPWRQNCSSALVDNPDISAIPLLTPSPLTISSPPNRRIRAFKHFNLRSSWKQVVSEME